MKKSQRPTGASFAPGAAAPIGRRPCRPVGRLFSSEVLQVVCWAVIVAFALGVRLVSLDDRPMHADEAVQAAITRDLWLSGRYRYDPHEFHGPTLNYLSVPALRLAGRNTFAETTAADFRRTPALFGAAAILFLLLLRDGLGRGAALAAGGLLAVSPAMVFYARSYIHETLLAFFTLAAIACGWRCWRMVRSCELAQSRVSAGVPLRPPRAAVWCWAAACGAAVGMMQATKETAVLSFAAAVLALGCMALAFRRRADSSPLCGRPADLAPAATCNLPADNGDADPTGRASAVSGVAVPQGEQSHRGANRLRQAAAMVAIATAAATAAIWFSSFGRNPQGIVDAVRTYTPWAQRAAGASPHVQPMSYFAGRLLWHRDDQGRWWSEASIVVAAAIGAAWAWRKRRIVPLDRAAIAAAPAPEPARGEQPFDPPDDSCGSHCGLVVFLAVYAVILAMIYSLIPYKTPWCMVQFWLPTLLVAGVGVGVIARSAWAAARRRDSGGIAAAVVLGLLAAAMFAQLGRQTHRAAFALAADPRNPYCCAPTLPSVGKLEQRLEALLLAWPDRPIAAAVVWHDGYYWPLPWYLRRFAPVGYWTSLPPIEPPDDGPRGASGANTASGSPPAPDWSSMPVIVASARFDAPLTARLSETHLMIDFYALRPDAMLMLWVREDLWMAHLKRLGRL